MLFRKNIRNTLLLVFIQLLPAASQELPDFYRLRLEQDVGNVTTDNDQENVQAQFEWFKKHPLNLNSANGNELRQSGLFNALQVNELLNHRRNFGSLASVYELQSVDGFSAAFIESISPYIQFDTKAFDPFRRHTYVETGLGRTLELSKGYTKTSRIHFAGDPYRIFTKFRSVDNAVTYGFSAEKDPGESFGGSAEPYGFDYYSGYITYHQKGFLQQATAGDYELNYGQGLVVWNSFAMRKTIDILSLCRAEQGIREHLSLDENRFLRGAVILLGSGSVNINLFVSQRWKDGVENPSHTGITSIEETGLHRTKTELLNKNSVQCRIAGMHNSLSIRGLTIGMTTVFQSFSMPLFPGTKPYQHFTGSGNDFINAGSDYTYAKSNLFIAGEAAWSGKDWAMIHQLLLQANKCIALAISVRRYGKGFYSVAGNAPGENSNVSNESGLLAGIKAELSPLLELNFYVDVYRFPWLRYGISLPSSGADYCLLLSWNPTKTLGIQVKQRLKREESGSNDNAVRKLISLYHSETRIRLQKKLSESATLIALADWNLKKTDDRGLLLCSELEYALFRKCLKCEFRYCLFDTDAYDTGIYLYDKTIPSFLSLSGYYYQGSSSTVMIKFTASKHWIFWGGWANIRYNNRQTIGSGPDQISGNTRNQVSFQCRFTF